MLTEGVEESSAQTTSYLIERELDTDILAAAGAQLPRKSTVEDYVKSLSGAARADLINHLQQNIDDFRDGIHHIQLHYEATTYRRRAIRLLQRITKICNTLPEILFISGIQCNQRHDPQFRGGFADVFMGSRGTTRVALKRLRTYTDNIKELDEIFQCVCKEVVLWRQFSHPHILPFLGVERHIFYPLCTIVSPWMENGNMLAYIKKRDLPATEIDTLLYEVVQGLDYLHKEGIIHGDLRAANVLVDDGGHARLADFGLTFISDFTSATVTTIPHTNTRWLAPELLEITENPKSTPASDIYAWACVCLEGYTLKPPLSYFTRDAHVLMVVTNKHCIHRPKRIECHGRILTDALWELMQHCWSPEPQQRPSGQELLRLLVNMPPASFLAVPDEQSAACRNPSRLDTAMLSVPAPASAPTPDSALLSPASCPTFPPHSSPLSPNGHSSSSSPHSAIGSSSLSPNGSSPLSVPSSVSLSGSNSSPLKSRSVSSLGLRWPSRKRSKSSAHVEGKASRGRSVSEADEEYKKLMQIRSPEGETGRAHRRNHSAQELGMQGAGHASIGNIGEPFPVPVVVRQSTPEATGSNHRGRMGRQRSISLASPREKRTLAKREVELHQLHHRQGKLSDLGIEGLPRDDADVAWAGRLVKGLRRRIARRDAELGPRERPPTNADMPEETDRGRLHSVFDDSELTNWLQTVQTPAFGDAQSAAEFTRLLESVHISSDDAFILRTSMETEGNANISQRLGNGDAEGRLLHKQRSAQSGLGMWLSAMREFAPSEPEDEERRQGRTSYRFNRDSVRTPFSPLFGPPETEQWARWARDGEGNFGSRPSFGISAESEDPWGCIDSAVEEWAAAAHSSRVPSLVGTLRFPNQEEQNLRSNFEDSTEELLAPASIGRAY